MGNLRDGGIIVIGASEYGDTWELTGIEDTHLSTYDVDDIIDAVTKYASPPIKIEIVLVNYRNGKNFLAFQVHELRPIFGISKHILSIFQDHIQ